MIKSRKKIVTEAEETLSPTSEPAPKNKRNYVEIPLPKISLQSLRSTSFTPLLVVGLIIASFLLGMLTTKIQYLEKTGAGPLVQGAETTPGAQGAVPSTPPQKVDVKPGHLPMQGNKDAKITIVEFSDFQCPFCKRFFDDAYPQIKKAYLDTGKAKLVFRHFPLTSIHPNAQKSSEAAECANEQGKFWDYHDLLFKNQDTWSIKAAADAATDFTTYAGELGLDTQQFSSCVTDGKYAKAVSDDAAEGATAGVTGTPAFFVDGYLLVGAQPFSAFQAQIDPLLK